MAISLLRSARFALLLAAGFALGVVAITIATATGGKNSFWQKIGISSTPNGSSLAVASCDLPAKDTSHDVYFVSCGGFF